MERLSVRLTDRMFLQLDALAAERGGDGGEAAVSSLLFNAFRALGPAATRREIATAAAALRESGDEEADGLLTADDPGPLNAIAYETGAYRFVALDLVMAYRNPEGFATLVRAEQPSTQGAD